MEKVIRLCNVSQDFAIISPRIIYYINGYGLLDSEPSDGELEDGWLLWSLRAAATDSGYNTLEKEDELWGNIAHEIFMAIDDGRLEKNEYLLPSAMMSPWRMSYINKFIDSFTESITYVASFKDVKILDYYRFDDSPATYNFIELTNDKVLFEENLKDENGKSLTSENEIKEYNNKVELINKIRDVYNIISPVLGIIALISYIALTIKIIIDLFKKKHDYIEKWIVSSSILGALVTLLLGIAYNNSCTAYSVKVLYLCGAHALYLAFSCLGFDMFFDKIKNYFTEERRKSLEKSN